MKILLTGATGFIGSKLIPELCGNHTVYAIAQEMQEKLPGGGTWIEQDLAGSLDYSKLPRELDAVIYLAQSSHYKEFPKMAQDIFDVNVKGVFNLLEYGRAVGLKKFIFASSGGIYGYSYEKFVEEDQIKPINFYLSSKYCAELMVANYGNFFATSIVRFFFVYGEGQKDKLFPRLLEKVQKGRKIVIEGQNGTTINPIYVGDAVRIFEPALRSGASDIYNVAGDEEVSIKEIVLLMGKLTGKNVMIEHCEAGNVKDILGDNTRMKKKLGVYPQVSLEEGISSMIRYGR